MGNWGFHSHLMVMSPLPHCVCEGQLGDRSVLELTLGVSEKPERQSHRALGRLKLWGLDVANSPILQVWTEKREDVNSSPKATQGHVTLDPVLFVSLFFLFHLFSDFFQCKHQRQASYTHFLT